MQIQEHVPLNEWTWWKIGGKADFFCLPNSVEEVREALEWAKAQQVPYTVLGGGTNVLVSDGGIEGLVICMRHLNQSRTEERDGRLVIEALAGAPKSELTKQFLRKRLAPALFLCGLPGDVGGGVVMNAGVSESIAPREFVEITDWVEVMDTQSLTIKRYQRQDLNWQYRHTEGWQPGIIVRAGFSWPLTSDVEIPRKVKEATQSRLKRQPLDMPSCGSTFKNPKEAGKSAGALIEQAGLKGFTVGGAQVSPKHANFIVNLGGAKAADVTQIIRHIQNEVKTRFGVSLETEVKLLGRW